MNNEHDDESDESRMMKISKKKIARVQLLRSIDNIVAVGSVITLHLIVCSEFNDPIEGLLKELDVKVILFYLENEENINNRNCSEESFKHIEYKVLNIFHVNNDVMVLKFNVVSIIGSCLNSYLKVIFNFKLNNNTSESFFIIPTIIGNFHIINDASNNHLKKSLLLHCYRNFDFEIPDVSGKNYNSSLLIKEEYGATLGSHVYDSSIVLMQFFINNIDIYIKNDTKFIELGSGCGLIGVFLSKICNNKINNNNKIILTDKKCQLKLLEENIKLNESLNFCISMELSWECKEHRNNLIRLKSELWREGNDIDIIIASDVMYDNDASKLFFDLI